MQATQQPKTNARAAICESFTEVILCSDLRGHRPGKSFCLVWVSTPDDGTGPLVYTEGPKCDKKTGCPNPETDSRPRLLRAGNELRRDSRSCLGLYTVKCFCTNSSVNCAIPPDTTSLPLSRMRTSVATRRANDSFCSTSSTVSPAPRKRVMTSPIS